MLWWLGWHWTICEPANSQPIDRRLTTYCDSPPAAVRAGAHLSDQMGAFALDGRQGPGPAPTCTALWGHIAPVPSGENGLGGEGGWRRGYAAVGSPGRLVCAVGCRGHNGCGGRYRRVGVFSHRRRGAVGLEGKALGDGVRDNVMFGACGQVWHRARVVTVVGRRPSQGGSRKHPGLRA